MKNESSGTPSSPSSYLLHYISWRATPEDDFLLALLAVMRTRTDVINCSVAPFNDHLLVFFGLNIILFPFWVSAETSGDYYQETGK